MGLTQKILLFTSLLVVALVLASLGFTTFQAERLAQRDIEKGLDETKNLWKTFEADRFNKLKLGHPGPQQRSRLQGPHPARGRRAGSGRLALRHPRRAQRGRGAPTSSWPPDPTGCMLARSDKPGAQGEDLSKAPIVMKPLEGEESSTVWRQGDRLFHAVSVPVSIGGDLVGVLVAGYAINEALADADPEAVAERRRLPDPRDGPASPALRVVAGTQRETPSAPLSPSRASPAEATARPSPSTWRAIATSPCRCP